MVFKWKGVLKIWKITSKQPCRNQIEIFAFLSSEFFAWFQSFFFFKRIQTGFCYLFVVMNCIVFFAVNSFFITSFTSCYSVFFSFFPFKKGIFKEWFSNFTEKSWTGYNCFPHQTTFSPTKLKFWPFCEIHLLGRGFSVKICSKTKNELKVARS